MENTQLYMISLSYATFGIIVKDGIVFHAPPIATWMVGKELKNIELWVDTKRGSINYVNL